MINGITYFRLKPKYEGDIVKNAGLEGCDIDKNFRFLEDKIVDKLTVSDDGMDLIITFRDGTTVTGEDVLANHFRYEFDKENGVLNIIDGNGDVISIDGLVSVDMLDEYLNHEYVISTDNTLIGNGQNTRPLGIHPMYRTGLYRAVDRLIDTELDEVLPLPEELRSGDRFLVNEAYSTYGTLYNYQGVLDIMNMLENDGSPWRVPTKADWDDMLNALEPNPADRNHNSTESNVTLGRIAGAILRQNDMWEFISQTPDSQSCIPSFGFDALPSGYGDDNKGLRYFGTETLSKFDNQITQRTTFWTSSYDDHNVAYIKSIGNRTNKVYQDIANGHEYFSLRLVKDYDGLNYSEFEDILGETYTTCLMPTKDGGHKVWTSVNISITGYDGFEINERNYYTPDEYEEEGNIRYFIWEWTGDGWMRNEMRRGESVYVDTRRVYGYEEITPEEEVIPQKDWTYFIDEESFNEAIPQATATTPVYVAYGNCQFVYVVTSYDETHTFEEISDEERNNPTFESPLYAKVEGTCDITYYIKRLETANTYLENVVTETDEDSGIYLLKLFDNPTKPYLALVQITGGNAGNGKTYDDIPDSWLGN